MKVIVTSTKIITPSKDFVGREHELAAALDIQEYQIIEAAGVPDLRSEAEKAREELQRLESTITPRRLREATLTEEGKAWLASVETLINQQRSKL